MSKLGAHVTQGQRTGYGELCEARPGVVVAADQGGALVEARDLSGGRAITVFRDTSIYLDAPAGIDQMTPAEAEAAADNHYPLLRDKWAQNPADYYTALNEPAGHNAGVMPSYTAYERRIVELAAADGYRICALNLASGTPDDGRVAGGESDGGIQTWIDVYVPHIRFVYERAGIYGRHAYDEAGVDRALQEAAYLRAQGLHGGLIITECGLDGGYGYRGDEAWMEWARALDGRLQEHANVAGAALWTLGDWQGANWQTAIPEMAAYLEANPSPRWEPGPSSGGGLDYKSVGVLAPQNATLEQMLWLRREHYEERRTIMQSHHEALRLRELGLPGSTTLVYNLERWSPAVQEALTAGDHELHSFAPSIEDIVDQLPKHPTKQYATRDLGAIDYITVHHSATGPTATPETIARYHVESRDWPGIAYHYLVYYDGRIYQTNYLETVSYHDTENAPSVGLCLVGNFTSAPPTVAQLAATRRLVEYLRDRLPGVIARPHRQVSQTACPGATWAAWWEAATGAPVPVVGTGEAPATIDMLPYLRGDGRAYMVQHSSGASEKFRTVRRDPWFLQVKNAQWEELRADDDWIWRRRDTSPGPAPPYAERPGAMRFYTQDEGDSIGARWAPRHMTIGQAWEGPGHHVQFFYKSDCAESAANSGSATNRTTLKAHHDRVTFNGITVEDVIELGGGEESFFYARGWGLIAWSSPWGESAISETGVEPDNDPEALDC